MNWKLVIYDFGNDSFFIQQTQSLIGINSIVEILYESQNSNMIDVVSLKHRMASDSVIEKYKTWKLENNLNFLSTLD